MARMASFMAFLLQMACMAMWWRHARGAVFCGLWLASILSGWLLLCCPLLPLLVLRPRAYRVAIDIVFAMWEIYPAVRTAKKAHFGLLLNLGSRYRYEPGILLSGTDPHGTGNHGGGDRRRGERQ